MRTVPSLKELVNFSRVTQGLTTPTRAKTARVGDPGTPWAKVNFAPAGLVFAQSFYYGNPERVLAHILKSLIFIGMRIGMPEAVPLQSSSGQG